AMKNQLKVMKYRSYRLLKEETQNVPWQGNAAFDIPGGRSLLVTPQEFRNKQIALKVRLQHGDKPVVDTTVRLNNGGNFLLGGPPHEGGVLVLSISATAPEISPYVITSCPTRRISSDLNRELKVSDRHSVAPSDPK